jgi:hypothetical protein
MPAFGTTPLHTGEGPEPIAPSTSLTGYNNYVTSTDYSYDLVPPPDSVQAEPQPVLISIPPDTSLAQTNPLEPMYYPGMENLEQPFFDLNDLQNFFEWENVEHEPPPTGVEGLGPLGWNGLSNMQ